jgi:hypothetical protein
MATSGVRRRVTDPGGTTYLLQAVPSGSVEWPVYAAQSLLAWLVQTVATTVVHRLVFRGGWTVLAWQSDVYAPKRRRVHKERFADEAEAQAALERLAGTAAGAGLV